jgi:hypothetical protein
MALTKLTAQDQEVRWLTAKSQAAEAAGRPA